jgi:hypothetical protein
LVANEGWYAVCPSQYDVADEGDDGDGDGDGDGCWVAMAYCSSLILASLEPDPAVYWSSDTYLSLLLLVVSCLAAVVSAAEVAFAGSGAVVVVEQLEPRLAGPAVTIHLSHQ